MPIIEPLTATPIEPGFIYMAPAGIHIVVEENYILNIDNSPLVHYSKPSIDVLFLSAAEVKEKAGAVKEILAKYPGTKNVLIVVDDKKIKTPSCRQPLFLEYRQSA